MADYNDLKQAINSVIKTNGNEEITGAILQNTLNSIVSVIGEFKTFSGIADPSTAPGTPDQNVFYLASTPGEYSNFGVTIRDGEIAVLLNAPGDTWSKETVMLSMNGEQFGIEGYYVARSSGGLVADPGYKVTPYLPIKVDTDIIVYGYIGGVAGNYVFYDKDYNYISYSYPTTPGNTKSVILAENVPSEAKYIRCTSAIAVSGYVIGTDSGLSNIYDKVNDLETEIPVYNVTLKNPPTSGNYNRTTARAAVPSAFRKDGLIICYLSDAGWEYDKYVGGSYTLDSNWFSLTYDIRGTIAETDGLRIDTYGREYPDTSYRGKSAYLRIAEDGIIIYNFTVTSLNPVDGGYAAVMLFDQEFNYVGYLVHPTTGNTIDSFTLDKTYIDTNFPEAYYFRVNIYNRALFNVYYPSGNIVVVPSSYKFPNRLTENLFDINGYTNKSTGKISDAGVSTYRTTPFLVLDSTSKIIVTGWSGITNAAALCCCYNKYKQFIGYVNADTNGLVYEYEIDKSELITGTVYVKFNRTVSQPILLLGVSPLLNHKDIQDYINNTQINTSNGIVKSGDLESGFDLTLAFKNNSLDVDQDELYVNVQNDLGQSTELPMSQKAITDAIGQNGSGAPKGFYDTLNDLETAHPTGDTGIYVVITDGNWYYWNGSAWTSGGLYQAPLSVVQEEGQSVSDVMSQKAVTDSLANNSEETLGILNSIEHANTNDYLRILNYEGNYENIHPKVLYFENSLWGWKYWMAYTPYPSGNIDAENPCIAVSNDGVNWETPAGLTNPITPQPAFGYNSDTHLVYREDTQVMELWYRPFDTSLLKNSIVRKLSNDGVNWGAEETIFDFTDQQMLSPAVIFEDNKYKLWFNISGGVWYTESAGNTPTNWSNAVELPIDFGDLSAWHMDIINNEVDGYEMVICCYEPGGNNNTADLYYVKQSYTSEFTKPEAIIRKSKNLKAIDYKAIYRASILKVDDLYMIYYSSINKTNNRAMALSYGLNIFGLNGYKFLLSEENRYKVITTPSTLTDYDISDIDTLAIQGNITVEIESFVGGYFGKELKLVVIGSTAIINIINDNTRMVLPGLVNKTININNMGAILVFTGTNSARLIAST